MRNVDLHLTDRVAIHVTSLHGEVLPTRPDGVPTLDDARSFAIRITDARVGLTGPDLGGLLNTVVFAYPGAPLRALAVRTDSSSIVQTGILHKGVDLRFRLKGSVSLTPDGSVRIHPSEVHVLGMNGEKVLHLVGMHLSNLLDLRGAHGATVAGDDFILNPTAILPPPTIQGRLAEIRIQGDTVVEQFVRTADDSIVRAHETADTGRSGFIHFRGGELRFGRLLMSNTDLRIVGTQAETTLDMSLPHYARQLAAGTSRTLENGALVVYMPNYSAVAAPDRRPESARH